MKYNVFISHSGTDRELSEKICDYLQSQGIKCWIDSRNITGKYAKSIIEGIEQSEMVVLIYSSSANTSEHVENEIDNAFCLGKMIIPFRIEGTPYSTVLRYYLSKTHYVDGLPEPMEALGQLCDQIKRNMTEKEQLEEVDEAFHTIAQWLKVDVNLVREALKEIKYRIEPSQTESNDELFNKLLNEFIQNELSDSSEENETGGKQTEGNENSGAQSSRYEMLHNAAGEILIVINSEESEPNNPRLVYDGSDRALMYRSRESAFMLNNIAPEARTVLMKAEEVAVVELKDDDVAREYHVPLRKIRSLRALE